jgi:hypothetical protein
MCSTGSIASGLSKVAIAISIVLAIVPADPSFQYVKGVPHCSQDCRSTGGEEAKERTGPLIRNVSRATVAHATTCEPEARRHDSQ